MLDVFLFPDLRYLFNSDWFMNKRTWVTLGRAANYNMNDPVCGLTHPRTSEWIFDQQGPLLYGFGSWQEN